MNWFSRRNLELVRQWYRFLTGPIAIVQQAAAQSGCSAIAQQAVSQLDKPAIRQQAAAQIPLVNNFGIRGSDEWDFEWMAGM